MIIFGKRDLADLIVKMAKSDNISEDTLAKVVDVITSDITDWNKPKTTDGDKC